VLVPLASGGRHECSPGNLPPHLRICEERGLHTATEIQGIGPIEAFRQSQIDVAATFNYTPYLCTALLFVLLTIPMSRLTDAVSRRYGYMPTGGAAQL